MKPTAASRPAPDDPCSCGSRKRYRNCCKPRQDRSRILIFIAVVIGGVFVAKIFFGPTPPVPAAPPGKVWSEEHGHYHDAAQPAGQPPAAGGGIPDAGASRAPLPAGSAGAAQPAGEAPPGKVWSPEHGHWHDAPAGGVTPVSPGGAPPGAAGPNVPQGGKLTPQPAGPVPPGKVWSPEHGHWHDAPPR